MQKFLDINMATLNKSLIIAGVTTRRDFWYFILFTWLVSLGGSIMDIFIPGNLVENIFSILLFVPTLTAAIRRMHDTDHSGWWILFPFVNLVFLLSSSKPSRWATSN
jgi:uncharacterized membrane protein YhaH (DUF805 family)